ncbi:MAG: thiamine biosynthesis protein ThiF, partial [Anaerolineae bacterium]|nr:thiamine biosynthesis protein ThiF [Anaerolineae bacterium]
HSQKLSQLGQCDLIIDATANTDAFNMLAAVAKYYGKPMIWVEVFTGGIGGFVGRSRPGIDPDVQSMRRIYHAFTAENPSLEIPLAVENYTGIVDDSTLWQATDADVSVIAAHVARFALDTLGSDSPSIFPYSMYLIGLQKAWVFTAPFHTIPISTDGHIDNQSENLENQQMVAAAIEFLRVLLSEHGDNDSGSSKDS